MTAANKADEALLWAFMNDLSYAHKSRLMHKQAIQAAALAKAKSEPQSNAEEVTRLRANIATTQKEFCNVGITVAEVVNPLRRKLGLASLRTEDVRAMGFSNAVVKKSDVKVVQGRSTASNNR